MQAEHTAAEVIKVVADALGEAHVYHPVNMRSDDVGGLIEVTGVECDGDDDCLLWTGVLTDAATGEQLGFWSVPDHWPTVDIHWS